MNTLKNWWEKNWKWFLPALLLTLFLLLAGFIFGLLSLISTAMKSSVAYQEAFDRAQSDPEVRQQLGLPIEAGWFTSGNINVSGSSGQADLAIPISGPQGEGTIYLNATKKMGAWKFNALEVKFKSSGERVDLLSE